MGWDEMDGCMDEWMGWMGWSDGMGWLGSMGQMYGIEFDFVEVIFSYLYGVVHSVIKS